MKSSSWPCLNRPAITAILAGACWMAWALPSEAQIVYTPAHIKIPSNGYYNLDLNNDGVTDLTVVSYHGKAGCDIVGEIYEIPASGNGVYIDNSSPAALSKGDEIGPSQPYYGGQALMASHEHDLCSHQILITGDWCEVKGRYLGLTFQINGETHYGWARLSVGWDTAVLTGYAYQTIPNMAITAGQKQ
jgi:hypothetical protein